MRKVTLCWCVLGILFGFCCGYLFSSKQSELGLSGSQEEDTLSGSKLMSVTAENPGPMGNDWTANVYTRSGKLVQIPVSNEVKRVWLRGTAPSTHAPLTD